MKHSFILILLSLSLIQERCSCQTKNKLIFEKVNIFTSVDTSYYDGKMSTFYVEHYIVSNYKDSKAVDSLIADFADKNSQNNCLMYNSYTMLFYKKSSITNKMHLENSPKDLDRYSQNNDLLYVFSWWDKGKKYSKQKYKNGESMEPKAKIIISDIPEN
jgi:hypothetical protein